ncbi:MAG: hypothetical protein PHG05_03215 [Candidatus Nanoarchaeia archaeon]|nr:hypothetical protein [Candidatus Nanoarchaeia archaeon]
MEEAEIINFQEKIREKKQKEIFKDITSTLGAINDYVNETVSDYYELMLKDPNTAIKKFQEYMYKIRHYNSESVFVESIAGGPNQDWTTPLINIIGIMYPSLEKEVRKESLLECLGFLDTLNYVYAQNHVELVNEPQLVSDIIINRSFYWCGAAEYVEWLKKNPEWKTFSELIPNTKSEFWLSLAVVDPKYSPLEIRTNFYKVFPDLMNRTKYALAAIAYNFAQGRSKQEGGNAEDYLNENLSHWDPTLHSDILEKIKEENWINLGDRYSA